MTVCFKRKIMYSLFFTTIISLIHFSVTLPLQPLMTRRVENTEAEKPIIFNWLKFESFRYTNMAAEVMELYNVNLNRSLTYQDVANGQTVLKPTTSTSSTKQTQQPLNYWSDLIPETNLPDDQIYSSASENFEIRVPRNESLDDEKNYKIKENNKKGTSEYLKWPYPPTLDNFPVENLTSNNTNSSKPENIGIPKNNQPAHVIIKTSTILPWDIVYKNNGRMNSENLLSGPPKKFSSTQSSLEIPSTWEPKRKIVEKEQFDKSDKAQSASEIKEIRVQIGDQEDENLKNASPIFEKINDNSPEKTDAFDNNNSKTKETGSNRKPLIQSEIQSTSIFMTEKPKNIEETINTENKQIKVYELLTSKENKNFELNETLTENVSIKEIKSQKNSYDYDATSIADKYDQGESENKDIIFKEKTSEKSFETSHFITDHGITSIIFKSDNDKPATTEKVDNVSQEKRESHESSDDHVPFSTEEENYEYSLDNSHEGDNLMEASEIHQVTVKTTPKLSETTFNFTNSDQLSSITTSDLKHNFITSAEYATSKSIEDQPATGEKIESHENSVDVMSFSTEEKNYDYPFHMDNSHEGDNSMEASEIHQVTVKTTPNPSETTFHFTNSDRRSSITISDLKHNTITSTEHTTTSKSNKDKDVNKEKFESNESLGDLTPFSIENKNDDYPFHIGISHAGDELMGASEVEEVTVQTTSEPSETTSHFNDSERRLSITISDLKHDGSITTTENNIILKSSTLKIEKEESENSSTEGNLFSKETSLVNDWGFEHNDKTNSASENHEIKIKTETAKTDTTLTNKEEIENIRFDEKSSENNEMTAKLGEIAVTKSPEQLSSLAIINLKNDGPITSTERTILKIDNDDTKATTTEKESSKDKIGSLSLDISHMLLGNDQTTTTTEITTMHNYNKKKEDTLTTTENIWGSSKESRNNKDEMDEIMSASENKYITIKVDEMTQMNKADKSKEDEESSTSNSVTTLKTETKDSLEIFENKEIKSLESLDPQFTTSKINQNWNDYNEKYEKTTNDIHPVMTNDSSSILFTNAENKNTSTEATDEHKDNSPVNNDYKDTSSLQEDENAIRFIDLDETEMSASDIHGITIKAEETTKKQIETTSYFSNFDHRSSNTNSHFTKDRKTTEHTTLKSDDNKATTVKSNTERSQDEFESHVNSDDHFSFSEEKNDYSFNFENSHEDKPMGAPEIQVEQTTQKLNETTSHFIDSNQRSSITISDLKHTSIEHTTFKSYDDKATTTVKIDSRSQEKVESRDILDGVPLSTEEGNNEIYSNNYDEDELMSASEIKEVKIQTTSKPSKTTPHFTVSGQHSSITISYLNHNTITSTEHTTSKSNEDKDVTKEKFESNESLGDLTPFSIENKNHEGDKLMGASEIEEVKIQTTSNPSETTSHFADSEQSTTISHHKHNYITSAEHNLFSMENKNDDYPFHLDNSHEGDKSMGASEIEEVIIQITPKPRETFHISHTRDELMGASEIEEVKIQKTSKPSETASHFTDSERRKSITISDLNHDSSTTSTGHVATSKSEDDKDTTEEKNHKEGSLEKIESYESSYDHVPFPAEEENDDYSLNLDNSHEKDRSMGASDIEEVTIHTTLKPSEITFLFTDSDHRSSITISDLRHDNSKTTTEGTTKTFNDGTTTKMDVKDNMTPIPESGSDILNNDYLDNWDNIMGGSEIKETRILPEIVKTDSVHPPTHHSDLRHDNSKTTTEGTTKTFNDGTTTKMDVKDNMTPIPESGSDILNNDYLDNWDNIMGGSEIKETRILPEIIKTDSVYPPTHHSDLRHDNSKTTTEGTTKTFNDGTTTKMDVKDNMTPIPESGSDILNNDYLDNWDNIMGGSEIKETRILPEIVKTDSVHPPTHHSDLRHDNSKTTTEGTTKTFNDGTTTKMDVKDNMTPILEIDSDILNNDYLDNWDNIMGGSEIKETRILPEIVKTDSVHPPTHHSDLRHDNSKTTTEGTTKTFNDGTTTKMDVKDNMTPIPESGSDILNNDYLDNWDNIMGGSEIKETRILPEIVKTDSVHPPTHHSDLRHDNSKTTTEGTTKTFNDGTTTKMDVKDNMTPILEIDSDILNNDYLDNWDNIMGGSEIKETRILPEIVKTDSVHPPTHHSDLRHDNSKTTTEGTTKTFNDGTTTKMDVKDNMTPILEIDSDILNNDYLDNWDNIMGGSEIKETRILPEIIKTDSVHPPTHHIENEQISGENSDKTTEKIFKNIDLWGEIMKRDKNKDKNFKEVVPQRKIEENESSESKSIQKTIELEILDSLKLKKNISASTPVNTSSISDLKKEEKIENEDDKSITTTIKNKILEETSKELIPSPYEHGDQVSPEEIGPHIFTSTYPPKINLDKVEITSIIKTKETNKNGPTTPKSQFNKYEKQEFTTNGYERSFTFYAPRQKTFDFGLPKILEESNLE